MEVQEYNKNKPKRYVRVTHLVPDESGKRLVFEDNMQEEEEYLREKQEDESKPKVLCRDCKNFKTLLSKNGVKGCWLLASYTLPPGATHYDQPHICSSFEEVERK
jgi:hypothetical protein